MATPRQLFALFCGTGLNTKGMSISLEKASSLISEMKNGTDISSELLRLGATGTPKKKQEDWQNIYDKARKAGLEAANKMVPQPMVVCGHENPLDDSSPVKESWYIPDGACGFAWINFAGNTSFGRWAKKQGLAKPAYGGGLQIWVGEFNQSIQRKEAYARAFAKVLNENGIKAYSQSRLD